MTNSFKPEDLVHFQISDYCALSKSIEFDQCLVFIEKTGKISFGHHFQLSACDYRVLFQLLVYFYRDFENAERFGMDLRKGILLTGPIGCGKTSLMFLMRYLLTRDFQYIMRDCRTIGIEFIKEGYPVIEKYTAKSFISTSEGFVPRTYCFDDLGLEPNFKHFGNEANVMAEILLSRYPLFLHEKMLTHATTNLSSDELEKLYGNRVRSRMREMFNLIAFGDDAIDKRK